MRLASLLFIALLAAGNAQAKTTPADYSGLVVRSGDCYFFNHPRNETQNSALGTGLVTNIIGATVNAVGAALKSAAGAKQASLEAQTPIVLSNGAGGLPRCIFVMNGTFALDPLNTGSAPAWAATTIFKDSGDRLGATPSALPDFFAEVALLHDGDGYLRAVPVVAQFNTPQFRRWLRPSGARAVTLAFTLRAPGGDERKPGAISFSLPLGSLSPGDVRRYVPCATLRRGLALGCATDRGEGDTVNDARDYADKHFFAETALFRIPVSGTPQRWSLEASETEIQGRSLTLQFASDMYEKQKGDIEQELRLAVLSSQRAAAERADMQASATALDGFSKALGAATSALDACIASGSTADAASAQGKMILTNLAVPVGRPSVFSNPGALAAAVGLEGRRDACRVARAEVAS